MSDTNQPHPLPAPEDEDASAFLLQRAGPRPGVPADRWVRVRGAVHRQWHQRIRRRTIGRRTVAAAALFAAVGALALFVRLTTFREHAEMAVLGETVARIERTEGKVLIGGPSSGARAGVRPLTRDDTVRAGEWVETDGTAQAALRLTNGTIVRLDRGSRAHLASSTIIELAGGAVYVDTGRDSSDLEVRTPLGIARHIGTQFEIRLRDSSLRVRVRSGVVELSRGDRAELVRRGTELTMTANATVSRTTIPVYGPAWEWAANAAPVFDMDGKPLAAFLEHLCREEGWTLRYADARLAHDASSIILHGSLEGLDRREALAVALTASELDHRFQDGELFVFETAPRH